MFMITLLVATKLYLRLRKEETSEDFKKKIIVRHLLYLGLFSFVFFYTVFDLYSIEIKDFLKDLLNI